MLEGLATIVAAIIAFFGEYSTRSITQEADI
jgi:hypothetical protein